MSADGAVGATDQPPAHQPGYPNLMGPRFRTGEPSANPTGVSKYQSQLRKAIEAQEPPAKVCEVIAAMREMAMSGNPKGAPAAAKVYLSAVGLEMSKTPTKVDLSDAPEDVMKYLAGKIQ